MTDLKLMEHSSKLVLLFPFLLENSHNDSLRSVEQLTDRRHADSAVYSTVA